jgi:hypothetical protein
VKTLIAKAVDALPARLWLPGNLHFFGRSTLHFCLGGNGNRTVEWNGNEIASGRRDFTGTWPFNSCSDTRPGAGSG